MAMFGLLSGTFLSSRCLGGILMDCIMDFFVGSIEGKIIGIKFFGMFRRRMIRGWWRR